MPSAPTPVTRHHRAARASARVHGAWLVISVLLLSVFGITTPVLATGSAGPDSPQATTLLDEKFMGPTATDWQLGGTAVLTSGNGDTAGNGWLRLTSALTYQAGYAYYKTAIPTSRGLVITFDYAAWGGAAADGTTFFLFDGATTSFNAGASGGSLGYAQKTGFNGLSNGYLGLGLDEFGNYSNPNEGRVGGIGFFPEAVALPAQRTSPPPYPSSTARRPFRPVSTARADLWRRTTSGRYRSP
jgi:hypothetical protein